MSDHADRVDQMQTGRDSNSCVARLRVPVRYCRQCGTVATIFHAGHGVIARKDRVRNFRLGAICESLGSSTRLGDSDRSAGDRQRLLRHFVHQGIQSGLFSKFVFGTYNFQSPRWRHRYVLFRSSTVGGQLGTLETAQVIDVRSQATITSIPCSLRVGNCHPGSDLKGGNAPDSGRWQTPNLSSQDAVIVRSQSMRGLWMSM